MTLPSGPTATFRVLGHPEPKGSKTANARGFGVRDSNAARLRPWEATVAAEAERAQRRVGTLDGTLDCDLVFRFPGPTTAPKWKRAMGEFPMDVMPDLDKLIRAVWDGLQAGGLIANDARIADSHATKLHVWDGWTGVRIIVRPLLVPTRQLPAAVTWSEQPLPFEEAPA